MTLNAGVGGNSYSPAAEPCNNFQQDNAMSSNACQPKSQYYLSFLTHLESHYSDNVCVHMALKDLKHCC